MLDLNTLSLPDLYRELARTGLVTRLVELARDEDLGPRPGVDVTSAASIPESARGRAELVAREAGVMAGLATVPEIVRLFGPGVSVELHGSDGAAVVGGQVIATLAGPMREILGAERTILNLVGRLSGVATLTSRYVAVAARGGAANVYDTRKTTPGLRALEKYAVRCGGGRCHRIGLHDAVLLKDNHLAGVPLDRLAGFVVGAAQAARRQAAATDGLRFVQCEVDSIEQLRVLLDAGGCGLDIVLLDNMVPDSVRQAVEMRRASGVKVELEASGGVTLETIAEIASTGVDRISCGAMTHHAVSLDVALDIRA